MTSSATLVPTALATIALVACDSVESGAPDASCTATWTDVLTNGSFDDGHTTWTEDPVEPPSICGASQVPFPVHTPQFAACLATDNNRVQTLAQVVTLPAGITRVRLSGMRCLLSQETTPGAKDTATFELRNADTGATVATLGTWSNEDGRGECDWSQFQLEAPVTAAPSRAQLWMHAKTNDLNVTSFYLDSLKLEVLSCR